MLEPDDPPICECRYDEARDEMDRDDCPFHCGFAPREADNSPGELGAIATAPDNIARKKSDVVRTTDMAAA